MQGLILNGSKNVFEVECEDGNIRDCPFKGKVLKAMNASDVGEIVGVSGNTITSRKGNWIYTWSREGKKINAKTKK